VNELDQNWQVPRCEIKELQPRQTKYCLCIPVINEGEKIRKQLEKIGKLGPIVDVIILDGGSTDGSLDTPFLIQMGVRTLITKKDKGKLSAQLRMGFSYALAQGYDGIITVDGNNKDSVESIPSFIEALDDGFDFVQGSRYVPGGVEINTPLSRKLAIKLIHAPFISFISGFRYTDTTNGFRAHSAKFLLDPRLQPFRDVFDTYELLAYLSVKAPQLNYKVKETPVTRQYPSHGKIPIRGNLLLIQILWNLFLKKYDPKVTRKKDISQTNNVAN
jgi:dolichol-phosphate mannosyltransferase